MTENYKLKRNAVGEDVYPQILILIKKNKGTPESFGAVIGLGGGILSALVAIIFFIIPWSLMVRNIHAIQGLSFICLLLFLPLLMLGAHCLDLLEKRSAPLPVIYLQSISYNLAPNLRNRGGAESRDLGLRS